jgi:proteasome lid subunit RPN8/RPN11
MQTTILLKSSIREQILHECIQKKPNEACGFVWGSAHSSFIQVEAFKPVPNCAVNPSVQFSMDPAFMIPLLMSRSENGLDIVGILHSHPTTPAIPSQEDLLSLWHKIPSHWIVSLQHPTACIAAYQFYHVGDPAKELSGVAHYRPLPITIIQD